MKQDDKEISAVSEAIKQIESQAAELFELQLTLVGGGVGEVVIA